MRQRVGGAQPLNRRIRADGQVVARQLQRGGNVEAVGDANGQIRRVLRHARLNGIDGRDHILTAAKQLSVVVREDGRHPIQIEAFDALKLEALKRKANDNTAGSDGFGALSENGAEAFRASLEDPRARIELVGETGCGSRQRDRDELPDDRGGELVEVRLEIAVEMRRVRLLAWQRCLAVHFQSLRTEETCEERRQILNWRKDDERILRPRIRRDGKQTDDEQHTLHGRYLRLNCVIQNSELRIKNHLLNSQFSILNYMNPLPANLANHPASGRSSQTHRLLAVGRLLPA